MDWLYNDGKGATVNSLHQNNHRLLINSLCHFEGVSVYHIGSILHFFFRWFVPEVEGMELSTEFIEVKLDLSDGRVLVDVLVNLVLSL